MNDISGCLKLVAVCWCNTGSTCPSHWDEDTVKAKMVSNGSIEQPWFGAIHEAMSPLQVFWGWEYFKTSSWHHINIICERSSCFLRHLCLEMSSTGNFDNSWQTKICKLTKKWKDNMITAVSRQNQPLAKVNLWDTSPPSNCVEQLGAENWLHKWSWWYLAQVVLLQG